jgi:hypothetical protein
MPTNLLGTVSLESWSFENGTIHCQYLHIYRDQNSRVEAEASKPAPNTGKFWIIIYTHKAFFFCLESYFTIRLMYSV